MKRSAALVTIVAAFGLSVCTSTPAPEQKASPTTPPAEVVTEVVTATVTNPPQPAAEVDGRLGYGALKLGMSLEEARAAGLTDLTWNDEAICVADDEVAISKKHGVVRITLPLDARTSKGIGVGSTFAEVKAVYQGASEYRAGWSAPVDDNAGYAFIGSTKLDHFADTDKVILIKLGSGSADCDMADL
ncbi:hypothetical protein ACFWN2_30070 [Lentzea sp. NPDC058436]|uniref:hypothetical protein n=1 Tax=Lentzea sp. NPDC058436 TaxID=3346499 RepID=UPI00365C7281